jgi:hypothetical protein
LIAISPEFSGFPFGEGKELEMAWEEKSETCIREYMSSHDWFIGWGS